ncbi:MAG TPA: AAA family ATPase, partial [Thermomicrobiales bacterium]|nr:AAA family ATPase [Thermomicrobiales bacterium]
LRDAPRLETVRMLADALTLPDDARHALLAAARPTAKRDDAESLRPPPASLPTPLTRLIGRETELHALQAKLAVSDVRLLTVTGAGGTGKTRLALEAAAKARERYLDDVVFVDLSLLNDPALVIPTVAAALGVRDSAAQLLRESLSRFLASKHLLLLLDSCEQVLAAAPEIAALLAASPSLTILATSREPLHVRGERELPLLPLPLPAADQSLSAADLARIPAIALFVERAEACRPDFVLTAENAAAVAAICRRLDGLPLAIELAAARSKALPPAALLGQMERRLPLLTGGRDLPARQRTMRDAIAWSADLLSPEQQRLFRRLAVFSGGFTLAAAEAVADSEGGMPVVDGVVALVEQSLLRQVAGTEEEPRYLMLEIVREFGIELLAEAGETEDARQRHAEHFLRLAADVMAASPTLMNRESLARVTADHDNVRLALAWFDVHGESEEMLRLSAMLYALWFGRGLYREGLQWAEQSLQRTSRVASPVRVQALDGAAMLAINQGDYARAERLLDEAGGLARELREPFLVGEVMSYSGYLAYRQGDFARAERLLADGLRRLRGEAASAHGGFALLILGDTAMAQEQLARAAILYQEAIDCFEEAGYAWGLSDAQAGLAGVHYCMGNLTQAAAGYRGSLERAWALGFPLHVASALQGLAAVAATAGRPDVGAQLFGSADSLIASLGAPMFPRDQPIRDRGLAALRSALGEERLPPAREAGREMSVEQAIAVATTVADAVTPSACSLRQDHAPGDRRQSKAEPDLP